MQWARIQDSLKHTWNIFYVQGQADESFAAKPEEDIETNEFLAVRKEHLEEEEKHSKRKPRGKATLETQVWF